ncbi:hypothetical protein AR688_08680 [Rheinheimera sp. EpRS3]|nr:hypothetical protein AR688_08680 [Rheinheimera sp. EpRS3]
MEERRYLNFNLDHGYPVGKGIYYECIICGDVIPSHPEEGMGCSCRNIFIDVDAGRVSIKNESQFKAFEKREQKGG